MLSCKFQKNLRFGNGTPDSNYVRGIKFLEKNKIKQSIEQSEDNE